MSKLVVICICVLLFSCDRKPFVETKLDLNIKGRDCQALQPRFKMTSNFGGERFEFEKCLREGSAASAMSADRAGDTVVVKFNNEGANVVYNVTLDIDSYPAYHFITIDGETFAIAPANQ